MTISHVRPTKRPVPERAAEAARFVAGAGRASRVEVAEALGLSPTGGVGRVLRHAVKAGWLKSSTGPRGGYVPGPVAPA